MIKFFEGIKTNKESKTFINLGKIIKIKKVTNGKLLYKNTTPVYLHPFMEYNPEKIQNIMNPYIDILDKKFKTYDFFKNKNYVSMPLSSKENIFDFPFVIKTDDGAGGNGVFLVKNPEEHLEVLNTIKGTFFYQEFIDLKDNVFDVRCLYFHDGVFITYKRTANKGDFRANISLGGVGSFMEIPHNMKVKIKRMCADIQKYSQRKSYALGFDFIIHKNKWYLIEINTCPGLSVPLKKYKYKKQIINSINSFRG